MGERDAVVVAEAADEMEAGLWLDALERAGIEARSFERGVGAALGGAVTSGLARYPVVVPRDQLAEARTIISDLSGESALAPIRDEAASRATQRRGFILAGMVVAFVVALGVIAALSG